MDPSFDAMKLYTAWTELEPGSRAKMKRVTKPEELLDIPEFYLLVAPFGWPEQRFALQRMVFCLTSGAIQNSEDETLSLGRALGNNGKISQQRVMQLIRQEFPSDMMQLRRLLIQAEPVNVHWPLLAKQLEWWGKYDRRSLLENYVISSFKKQTRKDTR